MHSKLATIGVINKTDTNKSEEVKLLADELQGEILEIPISKALRLYDIVVVLGNATDDDFYTPRLIKSGILDLDRRKKIKNYVNFIKMSPEYMKYFYFNEKNVCVNTENFRDVTVIPGNNYVKISGNDIKRINAAGQFLPKYIKSEIIDKYAEKLFTDAQYFPYLNSTINIITNALNQYGLDNIFISFNGGKDCTVLLHLLLSVINQMNTHGDKSLTCLYVRSDDPFEEIDAFVNDITTFYNLKLITKKSKIKTALQDLLSEHKYTACFMGTRRIDPHGGDLDYVQKTDPSWPEIIRICPLLDWNYTNIWNYLLEYKVPYCELYDRGYTSLGNVGDTAPNPELLASKVYGTNEGNDRFLPAFKLIDAEKERSGRLVR